MHTFDLKPKKQSDGFEGPFFAPNIHESKNKAVANKIQRKNGCDDY